MKRIKSFVLAMVLIFSLCPTVMMGEASAYYNPMYSVVDKSGAVKLSNINIPNGLSEKRWYLSLFDGLLLNNGNVQIVDEEKDVPRWVGTVFDAVKTTYNSTNTWKCQYCGAAEFTTSFNPNMSESKQVNVMYPQYKGYYAFPGLNIADGSKNGYWLQSLSYSDEGDPYRYGLTFPATQAFYFNTPVIWNTLDTRPYMTTENFPEYMRTQFDKLILENVTASKFNVAVLPPSIIPLANNGMQQLWTSTTAKYIAGNISLPQSYLNNEFPICYVPYMYMRDPTITGNKVKTSILPAVRGNNLAHPEAGSSYNIDYLKKGSTLRRTVSTTVGSVRVTVNGYSNSIRLGCADINYDTKTYEPCKDSHMVRAFMSDAQYNGYAVLPYTFPLLNANGTPYRPGSVTCNSCKRNIGGGYVAVGAIPYSEGNLSYSNGYRFNNPGQFAIGRTSTLQDSSTAWVTSYMWTTTFSKDGIGALDYVSLYNSRQWQYAPSDGNAGDKERDITCTVTGITFDGCTISSLPKLFPDGLEIGSKPRPNLLTNGTNPTRKPAPSKQIRYS